MTCQEARISLGAYTLGSLDTREEAEVRAHLEACPDCQREARELQALPELLADLTIEEASGPPQPSAELYESLRDRALQEDRSSHARRRQLVLAVAAGVAVLGLAGGALAIDRVQTAPKTYTASQGDIQLKVQLKSQDTGTAMNVKVRGLPAHTHCQLIAVGVDGQREDAGWWIADYEGEATVTGNTALSRPDLTQILVVDSNGNTLVSTPV
jgi:anti-sigma factor ChrR (cupin superfamily)